MNRLVVSLGRRFGSGGREGAKRLAEKLARGYLDKELLTIAAEKSGVSLAMLERADEKPLSAFSYSAHIPLNMYAGVYNIPVMGSAFSDDKLFAIQADAIRSEAEAKDCVIVGRCSDYILSGLECMVSVFVHASLDFRISRVCDIYEVSEKEAIKQIKAIDKKRSAYYEFYTGKKWGDAASYHLCLDVSKLGTERTVEAICAYLEIAQRRKDEAAVD